MPLTNWQKNQSRYPKEFFGIEKSNCDTCAYLGTDGDGYEYNGSWPICNKINKMGNLKTFPFKKEMSCWFPNFWLSSYAEFIYKNNGNEDPKAKEGWDGAFATILSLQEMNQC